MKPGNWRKAWWLSILLIFVSACSGALDRLFPGKQIEDIYRPPSLGASSTPAQSPPAALPGTPTSATIITPTPACVNNLLFLEDLTVPDGSLVLPGAQIDKRWGIENSGTCNWDQGFSLKLVAGPEMGARVKQALYPARSGTRATIRIVFSAPQEPGTYRSAWQAFSPNDQAFGDPIFIEVVVGTTEDG
ncbi:MAG: hypothetical protein JSV61_01920 [Anaerolineales bacterium]|nr:MAG: hypothetical protein JSV61_01920 [Anaerolineales bacterium]